MLDKLVLHIPFRSEHLRWTGKANDELPHVPVSALPVPLTAMDVKINDDGSYRVQGLATRFESLSSGHSGMAMKVYDKGMNCDPVVCLKCSPVKLLQGHNLFGFDDLRKAAVNMVALLAVIYPELYKMLAVEHTYISEFDVTYAIFIENQTTKMMFLDHLKSVSKGQTKNRGDAYATTIYFGAKNSRLKQLKVYSKREEMLEDAKKALKKGFARSSELITTLSNTDYAHNAVRFEATIKKRYLERKGLPFKLKDLVKHIDKHPEFYRSFWYDAFSDVLSALEGQEIQMINDDSVYAKIDAVYAKPLASGKISHTKTNRLFSFYQTLKAMGYDHLARVQSKTTFYRNMSELEAAGFSRSYLQNVHKAQGAKVIPLARIVKIDFSRQLPEGYVMPPDLFQEPHPDVAQIFSTKKLRAV